MDRTSRNMLIYKMDRKFRNSEEVREELDRLGIRDYPARLKGDFETAGFDEEQYKSDLIGVLVDNIPWIA